MEKWENRGRGRFGLVGYKHFKPVWAVEIKWSDRYFSKPADFKSLLKFTEINNFDKAVVTTIDKSGQIIYNEKAISFIPSSVYAYNVGVSTLTDKQNVTAV